MLRRFTAISVIAIAAPLLSAGCNLVGPNRNYDAELAHYKQIAKTVEHPQLNTPSSEHAFTPEPRTIDHNAAPGQPHEWWELSLDDAIQIAVTRSSVLRDLGGTIVRSPETMRTILNPAVIASEPRFGMEAALSEFDATLATNVTAEKNDRMVNNFVASGGARVFQQDLVNFQSQISKLGAAGTRMTLRGLSTYDFNNASFNRFPSVWDTLVDAEFRQPLLQGAGARFNRLAGPNSVPGFYNGVLIARVNTDISVADFEMGLRDLVSNVENAYWDLYFAFRDLDAKIQVRNASLEAWKRVKVLVESDQASGQVEREVQAREQYFRYEEEVQNALAGTLQQSTTNNNGSSGGSFRGIGGVLVSERRLRLAIGLPITDSRMIRPVEEPTHAKVSFEWSMTSDDAIARRPELLKQRLVIKRREMEYVAARNFLLPRFDVLGRYRFRGLGKGLIGDIDLPDDASDPNNFFERSSLSNLASGNFQEWQLGGEVSMPIGYRRGWAGVHHAQLQMARDKALLEEQERQVMHDLSNAVGDMERAYKNMETTYNRRLAGQQNVEILRFRLQSSQPVSAEALLEAERRFAEADIQYHRALVEHMLAIKNVHFEKGTLLEYGHIQLTEQVSFHHGPARSPAVIEGEPTPAMPPPPLPIPEPMPAPTAPLAPPQAAPLPTPPPPSASLPLPLGEGRGEGIPPSQIGPTLGPLTPPQPSPLPAPPPPSYLPPPPPPASTLPPPPPARASISAPPSLVPPALTIDPPPQNVRIPLPQFTEAQQPPSEQQRPEPTYAVTSAQPVFQFSPQSQRLPPPPQPAPPTQRQDIVSFAAEPRGRESIAESRPAHTNTSSRNRLPTPSILETESSNFPQPPSRDAVSFATAPHSSAVHATTIQHTPAHSHTVDARQPSTTSPPPEPVYAVTPSDPVILFWSKPLPPDAPSPPPRDVTASFAAPPRSASTQVIAIPSAQADASRSTHQIERAWYTDNPNN